MRTILLSFLILSACSATGVEGLKSNSIHDTKVVNGDPKVVASCVAAEFDKEPTGLGSIAMPAEGWREPNANTVQIFNSNFTSPTTSPGTYAYFATFTKSGENQTTVDVYSSRNVYFAFPATYVHDWFMKHLESCA